MKDYQKALKRVTLFFLFNPVSFNEQSYPNKTGLEQWLVTLQVTKQVQKNFFICYILSDQVWWCNVKQSFWVISKITSANLYKPVHDIINYSTSICLFGSGKCEKEGKKL